jgi:hypothetical protein
MRPLTIVQRSLFGDWWDISGSTPWTELPIVLDKSMPALCLRVSRPFGPKSTKSTADVLILLAAKSSRVE